MTQQLEEKWEQWARERGMEIGYEVGKVETLRQVLLNLLRDRFGTVPEALAQEIGACADVDRLHAATRQILHVPSLEDFRL